jgi:acetolactate synthase I/II/III large subunit
VTRSGGRILVDQLVAHGVDVAFCVPGESYLAVLDALRDAPVRLVTTRHEAAAANMAEAYGKLTGSPGVCLVTRGPGATHASIGVHTACQDSTPMILLVGQVARPVLGREAFQELDYGKSFSGLAKWAGQIDSADRVPELVARAFAVATSGRPGPVVLALPEDMLVETTSAEDVGPYRLPQAAPRAEDMQRFRGLLAEAQRPLAIVGEGGWSASAAEDMRAFAEANELPVAASYRCNDYVDNHSRIYAGHATIAMDPRLARRIADADVLLAVGGRLGEVPTAGYTLVEAPSPRQRLVHVHPDPAELGAVYRPELAVASSLREFAAAARALEPVDSATRREWTEAARVEYLATLRPRQLPGELQLADVLAFLRERLPHDAVVACGAGNFAAWVYRFYQFRQFGTQLGARGGAMGYGVPAALAAKVLDPDRIVVCVAGDGDFLMSGQELATAVQFGLDVVFLVVNNGTYGTIRMHQERQYPGRVFATDLVNPDFAAYARSFGAHGAVVERTEDFEEAFEGALATRRPALLELRVDPEALTPDATLAQIRNRR